jgi:hypothetical protein
MKKILLATIIAVTVAAGPSHAQQTITKDQLIGSWKVLNLKATIGDKVTYPLGDQVAASSWEPVMREPRWCTASQNPRRLPRSPPGRDIVR